MGPVLEKLAQEYADAALLAKVNCDEQPGLPAQFGVRSLPTVMLVKGAQSVGGFSGGKTEQELRELLDEHLPKLWETQFTQGVALIENEDFAGAVTLLKQAFNDSGERPDIATQYAIALMGLKRLDEAVATTKREK